MRKKIEVRKTPLFPKPLAKSAIVVYNQVKNRRILACPTVAQSETYKALSLLTDYRLSSKGNKILQTIDFKWFKKNNTKINTHHSVFAMWIHRQ